VNNESNFKELLNKDELASQIPDAIEIKEEDSSLNQSFPNIIRRLFVCARYLRVLILPLLF